MSESDGAFLRMAGIVKTFPGVVANDHVDFSVRRGEIHGLLGENGAGKSTLMKILYGLYRPDAGEITLDGERLDLASPKDAIRHGIGMVHQEFMLVPRLTVAENVVLGRREPAAVFRANGDGRVPDWLRENGVVQAVGRVFSLGLEAPRRRIARLADEYGFEIDPDAGIWELDVGQQQRVEILKALYRDVDLLVLDEPTAVLTPNEADRLFVTLDRLADDGLAIVFITHKLDEVMAFTDRVTVLRDGRTVDTVETSAVTRTELARTMVGRDVLFEVERAPRDVGAPVLVAEGLCADDDRGLEALSGVDLRVHEREVVGIAGVSGNGQKELAEALVGLRPLTDGAIAVGGADLTDAAPRRFVDAGVSFVPEDRLRYGCAAELSVMHNAVMKDYRRRAFGGVRLDYDAARAYAERLVEAFDVRGVRDVAETPAGDLSGGNLQKLVLARELAREPDLLVANQPTRGVDVGAIEFVRRTVLDQRAEGTAVVLVSENLDELFDLSDRLLVLYEGRVVHETTPAATTPEAVGLQMTGGGPTAEPGARRSSAARESSGDDG